MSTAASQKKGKKVANPSHVASQKQGKKVEHPSICARMIYRLQLLEKVSVWRGQVVVTSKLLKFIGSAFIIIADCRN